jgi:hypothetical protein
VNGDFLWSFNAQSDLVTTNVDNRNYDVVANDDALISLSGQNQHLQDSFSRVGTASNLQTNRVEVVCLLLSVS